MSRLSFREEEGVALLAKLYEHPEVPISVDTETTGLHVPVDDHCIGVSIAGVFPDGEAFKHYFATAHETGVNVARETVEKLQWVLLQPERLLIFANPQFDLLSLETIDGTRFDEINFIDICTMAHLVDENFPKSKSLESLGQHYVGAGKVQDPFVDQEKKTGNHHITPEVMWDYACEDAVVTWRVWFQLQDHPRWQELPENIWPDKQDLIRVLVQMKRYGVRIDTELAEEYVVKGEAEMKRLAAELGYPAKPTKKDPDPLPTLGPIALADIFLERLKMPIIKRGKPSPRWPDGAPSFDKSVMEEYDVLLESDERPEAKLVKQYRGWQKAVSASYRPYLTLLDSDGRLRCSYKTHGTVTGRLSCSVPNLQQIPKESIKEWNGRVKECFIPEDGYVLINADFSQLELRLGTAYANETKLKQVFEEGRDIFTEMAAQLGMSRQDTKTLVYSMQYGAGLQRIMNVFRVNKAQAERIRRNYFATYPSFKILSERCAASVEKNHEARIWTGRKRHFRFASESYKAMNSVIQGGAADIVERVMVRCFRELNSDDCRMLLQVHDSITWEVKAELVPEMMAAIKTAMEDVAGSVGHDEFDVRFATEVDYWTDREKERMGLTA